MRWISATMTLLSAVPAGAVAAQTFTVGAGRGWFSHIYDGVIVRSMPFSVYTNGSVVLTHPTLFSVRVAYTPKRWPIGMYGSAAFGAAQLRSWGGGPGYGFAAGTDADVRMYTLGVYRLVPLPSGLPQLEIGAGGALAHLDAEVNSTPWTGLLFPDLQSPGAEATVALLYPNVTSWIGGEIRGSWSAVHHSTEHFNFGTQVPGEPSPSSQWAGNIVFSVGLRVALN